MNKLNFSPMYAPYNFEAMNLYESGIRPGTVHTYNDATVRMFERYLYFRFFSLYPMEIPETWDKEFIQYNLFNSGFQMVAETKKYGVVPVLATIYGYNIYYHPNRFNVATPLIQMHNKRIGVDGELIRLTPDWFGLRDFFHFIAEKQALVSQAFDMNIINSKLAYIFGAKNKASAEALKKIFDQIQEGNPAVFTDSKYFRDENDKDSVFTWNQGVKNNFIAPELLEMFRELDRVFDDYMGIPDVGTEKKERLTNGEVNASGGKRISMAETFYTMLKDSIENVKKLYPELTGKLSVSYIYEENKASEETGVAL